MFIWSESFFQCLGVVSSGYWAGGFPSRNAWMLQHKQLKVDGLSWGGHIARTCVLLHCNSNLRTSPSLRLAGQHAFEPSIAGASSHVAGWRVKRCFYFCFTTMSKELIHQSIGCSCGNFISPWSRCFNNQVGSSRPIMEAFANFLLAAIVLRMQQIGDMKLDGALFTS